MKPAMTTFTMPLLLLAAIVATTAMASLPAQAQHSHQHPAPAVAQATPAQRWATDAPLRAGMAKIRTAVDALQHYERGHMGPEQAVELATQIQQQIAYLVANCKLEPQADAALHVIIAQLGAGAQALKDNPADLGAIPPMRQALQHYPRQFNDPGWAADEAEETR